MVFEQRSHKPQPPNCPKVCSNNCPTLDSQDYGGNQISKHQRKGSTLSHPIHLSSPKNCSNLATEREHASFSRLSHRKGKEFDKGEKKQSRRERWLIIRKQGKCLFKFKLPKKNKRVYLQI